MALEAQGGKVQDVTMTGSVSCFCFVAGLIYVAVLRCPQAAYLARSWCACLRLNTSCQVGSPQPYSFAKAVCWPG